MSSHITVVAISHWFMATQGRTLAVATLGFALGEALLPIGFVTLMGIVDWRWLWIVSGVMALLGGPVLIRLLREERTPQSVAQGRASTGMQSLQ